MQQSDLNGLSQLLAYVKQFVGWLTGLVGKAWKAITQSGIEINKPLDPQDQQKRRRSLLIFIAFIFLGIYFWQGLLEKLAVVLEEREVLSGEEVSSIIQSA